MADLITIKPSRTSRLELTPRVRRLQLGDGYSQRAADGLNTDGETWEVEWALISTANADTIEAALRATSGVDGFEWTAPNQATRKWIYTSISRSPAHGNMETLRAVFERVYDL